LHERRVIILGGNVVNAPLLRPGSAICRTTDKQVDTAALLGRPDNVESAIARQENARVFVFLRTTAYAHRRRQHRVGNGRGIENDLRLGLRQMQLRQVFAAGKDQTTQYRLDDEKSTTQLQIK
jgi:hypothetical protein